MGNEKCKVRKKRHFKGLFLYKENPLHRTHRSLQHLHITRSVHFAGLPTCFLSIPTCFLSTYILFIVLALSLSFPASTLSQSHPVIIRFSHVVSEDTPKGWGALEFARRVNKSLEGKVEVEVYPNGALYDDNEAIEAVAMGGLEMAAPSTAKFKGFVPGLQLFDMPFLFSDIHSVHKTIDGEIGRELKSIFQQRTLGITLLSFWDNAFKQFTCNVRPLRSPDDFKGLKFRIMDSEILEAEIGALGGVSYQSAFSDVFHLLAEGKMDGQENTASNIYTQEYHTVQRYMTLSNHGYLGYLVIVNQKFWEGLSWPVRKKITAILKEVSLGVREKAVAFNQHALAELKQYASSRDSFEIVHLTPNERNALRNAVSSVEKQFEDLIPARWIERIRQDISAKLPSP